MAVPISGLSSVADRILFTAHGPIVKAPLALLSGSNLQVLSETEVSIPTGSFGPSSVGKTLTISGSTGGRNDGEFEVAAVRSSTVLVLSGASFDCSDVAVTTARVVALANDLKARYNAHLMAVTAAPSVHGYFDPSDVVSAPTAVDLASATALLNLLRTAISAHIVKVGSGPKVHLVADTVNTPHYPAASALPEAVLLGNELLASYEAHRDGLGWHGARDVANRAQVQSARVAKLTGPLCGPLSWVLKDPRYGQIADSASDVAVTVNGSPASVDAVFGLLGAVVLSVRPGALDSVSIDYAWLEDPPLQFERLNSPEFVLNQGPRGSSGLPGHKYKSRSFLADPARASSAVRSPAVPKSTWWKYKGLERAYTASLNDPNLLLTNVPNNRVRYRVLETTAAESVVAYDPTTLPEDAADPWALEGSGTVSLEPGELVVVDPNPHAGPGESPPFYSHTADFTFPSSVSLAARVAVDASEPDGAFTGVAFGVTDGARASMVGFLETPANNLSSAVVLANDVKAKFNAHLVLTGTHLPDDPSDAVDSPDARDLASLLVLVNREKLLHNSHVAKGPVTIHLAADSGDSVSTPDAVDLETAVALANELASKFNAHRTATGVHYAADAANEVGPVKQVGLLTSRGFPEDHSSWESSAVDWTMVATYRLRREATGDSSVYVSGSVTPAASVPAADLPRTSDLDFRVDGSQSLFFGAVWRGSTSSSRWSFFRSDTLPLDSAQSADNKSVSYGAAVVPELDTSAPWASIGQGGGERVVAGPRLMLDSTASAPESIVSSLGLTTGAYRGFLRSEPILSDRTTSAVEFLASVPYYTFSVGNKAAGVFVDDGTFSVHLLFLQHTPSPATVLGTGTEPFAIASGNTAVISVGSAAPVIVTFPSPVTTAAGASSVINAAVGFALAADDGSGRVVLTTADSGASAKLVLSGGAALERLGLALGTYFGRDSNPEPKVSWFGESLPDSDVQPWAGSGSELAQMFGRTLRISDTSASGYRTYVQGDALLTAQILDPTADWKLDARLSVASRTPGPRVVSGTPLRFSGAMVVVDEGPSGKGLEVHLAEDDYGVEYLNVLSYNPGTGELDQQAFYAFAWGDGLPHTVNVFTSKLAGICVLVADGVALGTFSYTGLNAGFSGPSISFGSGAEPAANCDLRGAESVVDWQSVALFRDAKAADPSAASRRYVGIYSGGDPSVLSSYYLHQVDWSTPHTYRIVRDPISGVSVYLDGSSIPSISVGYDSLTLPPSGSSFLKGVDGSTPVVAFGSFDPVEISRTLWGPVRYSLGRITITERRIPPHQVLNQGNAFSSPDHLRTKTAHRHAGFRVYSGGTPLDEFMYDRSVPGFTILGEGTPPVPMTQDLRSRGGLVKTVTQTGAVAAVAFVNAKGYLSDLEDDTYNPVTATSPADDVVAAAVALRSVYNAHLTAVGVHPISDTVNNVTLAAPTDLTTAIAVMNSLKAKYNAHRVQAGVHSVNDAINSVTAANATGVQSFMTLAADFAAKFAAHVLRLDCHLILDAASFAYAYVPPPLLSRSVSFVNAIVAAYNAHVVQKRVHVTDDAKDSVALPPATDQATAIASANLLKLRFNSHRTADSSDSGAGIHVNDDTVNVVSAADASDLYTLVVLLDAEDAAFGAHRLQPNVHGSSVFVKLDPPPRVVYEGTKFFRTDTDEDGTVPEMPDGRGRIPGPLVRPFSENGKAVMFDTVSMVETVIEY